MQEILDMSEQTLKAETNKIMDFVLTCTGSDGLLCGWVNPIKLEHDPRHLLSDFGDWAPFFLYFNRTEPIKHHIARLPDYLDSRGILKSIHTRKGISVVTAFEHTDLLLGLLDCADQGLVEALVPAVNILQGCIAVFAIGKPAVRSHYLPQLHWSLPITSSVDATYIELLVQASKTLHKPELLNTAKDIAHYFSELAFTKNHHLFPVYSGVTFGLRSHQVQTMKHNTNAMFAILELYQHQPTPWIKTLITQWLDAVHNVMDVNGFAYFSVNLKNGKWVGDAIDIVPNVGLLDVLCDCADLLKNDQALEFARILGEKLLTWQDIHTGLVQRSPIKPETNLDAQTDLIIAWEKLTELTGDQRFSLAAKKLFSAIRTYHKYKNGFVLSCDSRTGVIVDHLYNTRYNALLLKVYIRYLNPGSIYNNPTILQLLKDR